MNKPICQVTGEEMVMTDTGWQAEEGCQTLWFAGCNTRWQDCSEQFPEENDDVSTK